MAEDIALPGEKLKTFRKEAGLTLKAVADELKVSIPFLSMVENGKSGISFENLHRMLRLYGKNLGDLTEQEEKARGHPPRSPRPEGTPLQKNAQPQAVPAGHGADPAVCAGAQLVGQGRTAFIPPQVRSAGGPVGGDLRP